MRGIVQEWLDKAEADRHSALREYRARRHPNYDACCFHAQQCVEKHLKGVLQHHDIPFGKTHDLAALLALVLPVYPLWEALRPDMELLTQFAVQFRYPGNSANREMAKLALAAMKRCADQLVETV